MVIDVSRKYLPGMSCSLDDKRVKINFGDGYAYLASKKKEWDVIIVDSSDPVGTISLSFSLSLFLPPTFVKITHSPSFL
jgi:spermidine synthase